MRDTNPNNRGKKEKRAGRIQGDSSGRSSSIGSGRRMREAEKQGKKLARQGEGEGSPQSPLSSRFPRRSSEGHGLERPTQKGAGRLKKGRSLAGISSLSPSRGKNGRMASSAARDGRDEHGASTHAPRTGRRDGLASAKGSSRGGKGAPRNNGPLLGNLGNREKKQARNTGLRESGARSSRAAGSGGRTRSAAPSASRKETSFSSSRNAAPKSRRVSAAAEARERAKERQIAREQRNRVIVVVGIVVALILGIALGVTYIRGNLQRHNENVKAVPTNLYTPIACTPSMLETSVKASDGAAGSPVSIVLTLRNTSTENPCYINVGSSNLKVNITSGEAQTSDVSACASWDESKLLLLNREMSTQYTVSWNGGTAASGCGSTNAPAQAGTYVATLSFADASAPQAVDSFVLR